MAVSALPLVFLAGFLCQAANGDSKDTSCLDGSCEVIADQGSSMLVTNMQRRDTGKSSVGVHTSVTSIFKVDLAGAPNFLQMSNSEIMKYVKHHESACCDWTVGAAFKHNTRFRPFVGLNGWIK